MTQRATNGAGEKAKPQRPGKPLWRTAFDVVERPVASASESWVQSDTFMDALALGVRAQRRSQRELHRAVRMWLGVWNLPSRSDLVELRNQIAGLERQVRDLAADVEARGTALNGRGRAPAPRCRA